MPNWKSYDSSVRLLSAILAAHPELRLNYQEISRRYGGDCTVSALENRFRRIKGDAKALNDALAAGIDPFTIPTDSLNGKIGGGKEIAKYYEDCTASALDHRFRPIKKEALAMRASIADKYGEDVTAKAVSTRFERLKKEPQWQLTNSLSGSNGAGNGIAPVKPKAAPRKKKNVAATGSSNGDDDEDFDEKKPTPKKSTLNKTQGGRVSKPQTPRKNGSFNANMAAITVPSDDEDNIMKREAAGNGFHRNGSGYGNSFAMDDDAGDDDDAKFYEANDYGSEGDMV